MKYILLLAMFLSIAVGADRTNHATVDNPGWVTYKMGFMDGMIYQLERSNGTEKRADWKSVMTNQFKGYSTKKDEAR